MTKNFIRVNIEKSPVEFSCPHCETILLTYLEGYSSATKLPSSCPYCFGRLDPTGVQPYTGEAKSAPSSGGNTGGASGSGGGSVLPGKPNPGGGNLGFDEIV